jgi:HK97 family phage major capsid protein
MNKKIVELKEQRASKIEEMTGLNPALNGENKEMTVEDAQKRFDTLDTEIISLDATIAREERIESLNKSVVKNAPKKEEDKIKERFDLSKAISARVNGTPLEGLELEMHQEGIKEFGRASGHEIQGNILIPRMLISRANETKTTGAAGGHIPTKVNALDVNATRPVYQEIGCTVYDGLQGKVDLPFSTGHNAEFGVTESSGSATESSPTLTKGTLSAERVQGWKNYTREYLAESVVMSDMITDMVESIDRSISNKMSTLTRDANELTGFVTGTDVTAVTTWSGVLDLIAALKSDNFRREGFLMSKELFYELAATERASGTAQFIVKEEHGGAQKGNIFGTLALGTAGMGVQNTDDYAITYGDFSKCYIGKWSGIELLVNPYTNSKTGLIEITFSQLADVVVNALGFASKTNVGLA